MYCNQVSVRINIFVINFVSKLLILLHYLFYIGVSGMQTTLQTHIFMQLAIHFHLEMKIKINNGPKPQ